MPPNHVGLVFLRTSYHVQWSLLSCPKGTGKTMLAKATATECNCNFISVSMSQLIHADVGGSEKAVSALFEMARESSPCIVFFDEFQSLFGSRDSGGQINKRMVSQLLLELDSITSCQAVVPPAFASNEQQEEQRKDQQERQNQQRIMLIAVSRCFSYHNTHS